MLGNVAHDASEGADTQSLMARDGDVVLPSLMRRQAQVASGLAGDSVAAGLQGLGEGVAREVTGESHAVMTSSFTKCSRMTCGAMPSSK